MKEDYEVRRATRQDQESIGRGWRKAYSDYDFPFQYLFPERYEWLVYQNPFLEKPDQDMPIWIAKKGDEVAAWTLAMALPMELNGQTYWGAWGNLAFTLPEHRRQGLAMALQRNYLRNYEIFIGLGMSKGNRKLQYVFGGKTGKPVLAYLKLIKRFHARTLYASFLSHIKKRRRLRWTSFFAFVGGLGLRALFGFVLGLLYKAGQKKKSLEEDGTLSIQEVEAFGDETDLLWQQARGNYTFAVSRDSRYLNWKYVQQPHLDYKRYLFKNEAGEVEGLLVYRMTNPPELPQGIITEIILRREDAGLERQILEFAEKQLRVAGADMILCGASTEVHCQALEEQGFRMMFVNVPVFTFPPEVWEKIDYERAHAGEWLLSLGDSDQDMVHLSNQPYFSALVRILLGKVPGSDALEIDPEAVIEEYKKKAAEREKAKREA
ncbi:hypothetical protein ACFL0G_04490 [Candidatus Zixiibacteriota bacterium]